MPREQMGTGEFTNQNYILRRDQLKQNEVISFCGLNMQTTSISLRFFTLLAKAMFKTDA